MPHQVLPSLGSTPLTLVKTPPFVDETPTGYLIVNLAKTVLATKRAENARNRAKISGNEFSRRDLSDKRIPEAPTPPKRIKKISPTPSQIYYQAPF